MKRYATIASLLSSPLFAHSQPYSNEMFLKLMGGNAIKAQELDVFCRSTGRSAKDCVTVFGGSGNLTAEAARKCAAESARYQSPIGADGKIDESRAHKIEGRTWHTHYASGGDTGRVHRHFYTESDRQRAYEAKKRELYADYERAVKGLRNETTKTDVGTAAGKGSVGVPGVGSAEMSGGGTQTTVTELAIFTAQDRAAIEAEAEKARKHPTRTSIEPTGLCFAGEKFCDDGEGNSVPNENYDPAVEKKEKEAEKKTGKKTSSNDDLSTPQHDHDHEEFADIDPNGQGGEIWAGSSSGCNPSEAIVRPIMDPESRPATWMEICLITETRKLERQMGSTTKAEVDPRLEKEKKAAELLKSGFCDESVYGYTYCAKYNFKQDSVVAVGVATEKKDHYNNAMDKWKKTGFCDASALGGDFCKGALDKWRVNPVIDLEGRDTGRPSLILKPNGHNPKVGP